MSRRHGAPAQPARQRVVYDNDPERITRPDTVPAALRFAENSDISSGVEQRGTRELAPYPRLPEVLPIRDEPTVVDPPPQRVSADRRATEAVKELRSGPRHRTVSTVPPPSRARQKLARAVNVAALTVEQRRRPEQVPSSALPPKARANGRWLLVLAFALTAIASAAIGTTLGNGSVERVVGRGVDSPAPRATPFMLPISKALQTPREPLLSPSPVPAPVTEAVEVQSVRLEDLPLAKQDQPRIKTKRAAAARRSQRKKL